MKFEINLSHLSWEKLVGKTVQKIGGGVPT